MRSIYIYNEPYHPRHSTHIISSRVPVVWFGICCSISSSPSLLPIALPLWLFLMRVIATPGGGFIYEYFDEETELEHILQMSHSLCLAHLPAGLSHPGRAQPTFAMVASIYKDVEQSDRLPYLYVLERVGIFLRVRATCRFALSYCSSWYQDIVKFGVRGHISLREVQNRLKREAERQCTALGCDCFDCPIEWLQAGWMCPATLA